MNHHPSRGSPQGAGVGAASAATAGGDGLAWVHDLADRLPQLVWSCGADGGCDFLGRRWAEYTGVDDRRHLGLGWLDAVHPDDRPRAAAAWVRFLDGGAEYDVEYRLRRFDGVYRWFKARGVLLPGGRTLGTTTDIDDQKRAEAALLESRERLEAALAASGTGTFRWDIITDALDWDAPLDRLFGLPPGLAVRSLDAFLARVHPDDRAGVVERCQRCRTEGADFAMEFRVVWPDGSVRWLDDRGRTFLGADGRPAYMTGACVDVTARKLTEQRLRDSEARVRDVLESVTDAFFAVDADWRFVYLNRQAERLLDRAPGELLGAVLWDAYPALDATEFGRAYRDAARDRLTRSVTSYYPDHGRWYETHVYPAASGGITVYFRNVTETIRAQQEIVRLAEQRRLALDAAGLGAWHLLPESGELNTDARVRATFGVPDGPFDYATALAAIHPDDRDRVRAGVAAAADPSDPRPYSDVHRVVRPDGSVRWVHAVGRASFTGEGPARRLTSLDGILADVTEKKATEEAVRRGEQRLQAAHDLLEGITEGTRDLIAAIDPDYRYTAANAAYRRDFRRVFGTDAAVGGSMVEALAHLPDDQARAVELWGRALRGENFEVTTTFGDPGLGTRVFEMRFNPIRDAAGRVVGASEIARDVTERVRAEEALKDADRRKDEFLALLAHELRNPLAPLRNGLQVLRLAGSDAVAADEARQMMDRQLTHMVRLVDDLLDVSRVASGKLVLRIQPLTLADVVATAVETARPAIDDRGHTLTVDLPPESIHLEGDLTRLAQVVANLLTNAARYTPPGGTIRVAAAPDGGDAVLRVTDNGLGIPAESLPRIFEMFTQVDRPADGPTGGLGIGLSLVRGLVEMHGGRVTAESGGPGAGSTFTVRLPLARPSGREPRPSSRAPRHAPAPPRRVLVVDDNADAARSMARLLKLLGHTVATAADGLAAVDTAESFRPELILMDVGMPHLNGYDATRRIREREWGRAVRIVALTGWGQEGDRVQSSAAGCDGHLVKPIDLTDLEPYLLAPPPNPATRPST